MQAKWIKLDLISAWILLTKILHRPIDESQTATKSISALVEVHPFCSVTVEFTEVTKQRLQTAACQTSC